MPETTDTNPSLNESEAIALVNQLMAFPAVKAALYTSFRDAIVKEASAAAVDTVNGALSSDAFAEHIGRMVESAAPAAAVGRVVVLPHRLMRSGGEVAGLAILPTGHTLYEDDARHAILSTPSGALFNIGEDFTQALEAIEPAAAEPLKAAAAAARAEEARKAAARAEQEAAVLAKQAAKPQPPPKRGLWGFLKQ